MFFQLYFFSTVWIQCVHVHVHVKDIRSCNPIHVICQIYVHPLSLSLSFSLSLSPPLSLSPLSQLLYPVHCSLMEGLEKSIEGRHGSGQPDVTQIFISQHSGFLHYGQYAVRLPSAVEKVSYQNQDIFMWLGLRKSNILIIFYYEYSHVQFDFPQYWQY